MKHLIKLWNICVMNPLRRIQYKIIDVLGYYKYEYRIMELERIVQSQKQHIERMEYYLSNEFQRDMDYIKNEIRENRFRMEYLEHEVNSNRISINNVN